MSGEMSKATAFRIIQEQIASAIAAPKCHKCGCLQQTVEALSATAEGQHELAETLDRARQVFIPKEYDCLGCPVCYPAIAANAFAEAHPEAGAKLDLCPTEEPGTRSGWPPLAGGYYVCVLLRLRLALLLLVGSLRNPTASDHEQAEPSLVRKPNDRLDAKIPRIVRQYIPRPFLLL